MYFFLFAPDLGFSLHFITLVCLVLFPFQYLQRTFFSYLFPVHCWTVLFAFFCRSFYCCGVAKITTFLFPAIFFCSFFRDPLSLWFPSLPVRITASLFPVIFTVFIRTLLFQSGCKGKDFHVTSKYFLIYFSAPFRRMLLLAILTLKGFIPLSFPALTPCSSSWWK